jgi:hypothetical protein
MCEPTTIMMGVGMAVSLAGTVMQASAQKTAGDNAQNAANYKAAVNKQNADVREQDAERTLLAGRAQAGEKGLQVKAKRERALAGAAGAGLAIGEDGSIEDLAGDITGVGKLDQLTLYHDAQIQARNLNIGAQNLRNNAQLQEFEGANAASQGRAKALGTLVSGVGKTASSVSRKWDAFSGGGSLGGDFAGDIGDTSASFDSLKWQF